jgi:hypothetical protein
VKLWKAALVLGVTALATAAASDRRHYSLSNRYNANYAATWTELNNHATAITALQNQFTSAQVTFLNSLSQMTGTEWASGERDYVNASINDINALVEKLQRNGLMGL